MISEALGRVMNGVSPYASVVCIQTAHAIVIKQCTHLRPNSENKVESTLGRMQLSAPVGYQVVEYADDHMRCDGNEL